MANLSATNPNLAPASNGKARRKIAVDALTILRDRTDGAETATAAETPIALDVEKLGNCAIQINGTTAGTIDGSNLWTLAVTVADNVSMSDPTTVYSIASTPATFDRYIAIDGRMLESIRLAGQDESVYIRVTATKTGTTATGITYGAYIVPC